MADIPVKNYRAHASWPGRGISEAEQFDFMQIMPCEEV